MYDGAAGPHSWDDCGYFPVLNCGALQCRDPHILELLPSDILDHLVYEAPQLALCTKHLMQSHEGMLQTMRYFYLNPFPPCPVMYEMFPGGFHCSNWQELLNRSRGCAFASRFFAWKHADYVKNGPRDWVACAAVLSDIVTQVMDSVPNFAEEDCLMPPEL